MFPIRKQIRQQAKKVILSAILGAIALSPTGCSCELIEPGYVGIMYDKSGENRSIDKVKVAFGRVTYSPITTGLIVYPISVVRVIWTKVPTEGSPNDESFTFQTSEGVSLNADVAFSFHIDEKKAPDIYVKYRKDVDTLTDGFMRDLVRSAMASVASNYTVDQILGDKRSVYEADSLKIIKDKLEPEGFIVDAFSVINEIRAPNEIRQKMNAKIEATQAAIAAENKLRQTKAEAEQKIAEAEGNARAILLRAEAEAKANEIIRQSATPEVMRYRMQERFLEKWDGQLPQVMGDKSDIMMGIGAGTVGKRGE